MGQLSRQQIVAGLDHLGLAGPARSASERLRRQRSEWQGRLEYLLDRPLRRENLSLLRVPAPDGLPLPPPHLVHNVVGEYRLAGFYEGGAWAATSIERVLSRAGLRLDGFGHVLDFGCGCGRVIRHIAQRTEARLSGTDLNPRLVNWCARSLPIARFTVNRLEPPLPFPDATFDFVYSISVFTHLPEPLQRSWMAELGRVMSPGGVLLFSTHGESRLNELSPQDRERYERGEFVVGGERFSGTNACGAYHPPTYVRDHLVKRFDLLEHVPGGMEDANQDAYLVRRTA